MRANAKITCDAEGCTKQLGEKNDHIIVVANHVVATEATDGVPQSVFSGDYDFCSWEHAAKTVGTFAGSAAEAREARLDALREHAKAEAQAEADAAEAAEAAEREAAEAAASSAE